MNVRELRERRGEVTLVDVRRQSEWEAGHIAGAIHYEGGRVAWDELSFPKDRPLAIQCASGNRSMIAISVLKRRGVQNVIQVEGGITAWQMHRFELVHDSVV
jgi:hydroxyacylglutathione hydrolase